jgi:hypothetical protein
VQADRGLVQDVEHALQVRPDLRGQADALPLAAGERGRAATERQVPHADVLEKLQAVLEIPDTLQATSLSGNARTGWRVHGSHKG